MDAGYFAYAHIWISGVNGWENIDQKRESWSGRAELRMTLSFLASQKGNTSGYRVCEAGCQKMG